MAIIYGTDENEVFKGYKGDNQYQGNGGYDTYRDYDGNEVYYYNQGDGTDTIQDSVGTDKIVFGDGITFNDLSFEAYGNNLHVNLASGEMINIVDWIRREASQIESFEFSDGSSVTNEDVNNILNGTYNPIGDTPGDTPAYEVPIPTYIGTDNYDYIDHQSGDNIYYAKKESDWIRDYDGNDAYIFSKGDVQDTYKDFGGTDELIFTGGITKDDLLFFRYNNDIHICVEYSTDKVDISKGMESYYGIEKIQFEDGSSLSRDEYLSLISDTPVIIGNSDSSVDYGVEDDEVLYGIQGDDTIYSYSGDDLIYAGSGDDVVFAGDGNDDIQGNTGNDILYGGLGDDVYCGYYDYQNMGRDLLFDEGGNDMLYLEDYLSSETSFNAYDSNGDNNLDALKLNLKNDTVVIIEEYFNNASSKIEESIAGMGYIENIAFQNTEVNLSNLQTYLT